MKNPPWTRDEHLLALDFYIKYNPRIPGKESKEVAQLSALLNALQVKLGGEKLDTFRNTAGVYMKLMNFRRFDPSYSGSGLANGNKDEEVVWNHYASQPAELSRLAAHISQFIASSDEVAEAIPPLGIDEEEGNEGQLLSRVHRYRERDRSLVQKKKQKFLLLNPKIQCEACGFDFEQTYGDRGANFIECHHTKPVSELEANGKTKVSDLILLCSNCHRMIHRRKPWLSIDELVARIAKP